MNNSLVYRFYDLNTLTYVGRGYTEVFNDFEFKYLERSTINAPVEVLDFSRNMYGLLVSVYMGRENIFVGVCMGDYDGSQIEVLDLITALDHKFISLGYNTKNVVIEDLVEQIFTDRFITNSDPLMNISNLNIIKTSATTGTILLDETCNLSDIISKIFLQYRIILKLDYNYANNTLDLTIGANTQDSINILENNSQVSELDFGDFGSFVNKVELYDNDTKAYIDTYFMTYENGITNNPNNIDRIYPVIGDISFISFSEDEDAQVTLDNEVNSILVEPVFNNEITFKLVKNNNIYSDLRIGTPINLYSRRGLIRTIITAISYTSDDKSYTITCGANNFTLSDLLNSIL